MRAFSLLALACLVPLLAASAGRAASPDQVQSCAALTGRTIGGAVIQSATWLPQGGTVGTTQGALPFCRVIGLAPPSADSRIGFEVWLPPAPAWNGKFQGEGSGGSAGAISTGAMLEALKAGFASMSTDNGHLT